MPIVCFFIWLVLLASSLTAQNLVPNPSFEEHNQYPCLQVDPPQYITQYFNDWYVPTGGSTDLWNADTTNRLRCTNKALRVTSLSARTGTFFIGLFTLLNHPYTKNAREYFQVRLNQALVPGKIYYAEVFVAPFDSIPIFSNNLGFYFSTQPVQLKEALPYIGSPILVHPQVNASTVITGAGQWHKVSGCFLADKAYKYLTIGNFFDDAHTQQVVNNAKSIPLYGGPAAYYFVDDVTVREATMQQHLSAINFGADTTLCSGQFLNLSLPHLSDVIYRWQDGSTKPNYTITQSGTYSVTASVGLCSVTDSLHVTILPTLKLPPDTTLCRGESLTLTPNYSASRLVWNTGSTDSSLRVDQPGQYWVHLPNPYCVLADTITVQVVDCPSNVPNVFTPNGDGKNETFVLDNISLRPWRLEVYNRWGSRVFESESYHNEWRGEGLPQGVYYYQLYCEPLRRRLKGWVQILR